MLSATSPLSTTDASILSLFDEDDFIINPDNWTEALAEQLANNAEISTLEPKQNRTENLSTISISN